jgi:fatty acid synthase subunit alpha, fungi type
LDYLGAIPSFVSSIPGVGVFQTGNEVKLTIPVPATEDRLKDLAGPELNWWHSLRPSSLCRTRLTSPIPSAVSLLLRLIIRLLGGQPHHLSVYGATRSFASHQFDFLAVDIKYNPSSRLISLTLFEERQEVTEGRNKRIKEFYWRLWFGDEEKLPELNVRGTFTGEEVTISARDVEAFCAVVGNQQEKSKNSRLLALTRLRHQWISPLFYFIYLNLLLMSACPGAI